MNIALIVRRLNVKGGTQRQVLSLARELKKMGHRVKLYAVFYEPEKCYADLLDGLEVVSLGQTSLKSERFNFLRNFFYEHKIAKKLALLISPDTHILNPHDQLSFKAAYYYKKCVKNIASVWNVNDVPLLRWGYVRRREVDNNFSQSFIKRVLYFLFDWYDYLKFMRVQDKIITLNDFSKYLFKKYFGRDCVVIRSGLDAELFQYKERPPPSKNMRLLTSGILMPHRRFEDSIRAVKILFDRGYQPSLTIIGDYKSDPVYYSKLVQLAKELGVSNSVHFIGGVSEADLVKAYWEHDIFIFQHHLQSYGLAAFEAASTGLPVIVSRTAGFHEVMTNHENALFIRPKNPEDIAGRVQELVDNPGLYAKISEAGSSFVRANFSWQKYAEDILRVFKETMRNYPSVTS